MPPLFARKVTDAEWIILEGGPEREGSCAVQENWEFGKVFESSDTNSPLAMDRQVSQARQDI
jgi:hypothetical protein